MMNMLRAFLEFHGDSNSIINQKKMLEKYATEQGFTNLLYYFVF